MSDDLPLVGLKTKEEIVKNWLPRYTGTPLEQFGDRILITNFSNYLRKFSERFKAPILGLNNTFQTCTNSEGLTMINFGMGSANAATLMDLLTAVMPKAVLLLGKCGGLKKSTEIGHFVLPIGAIRGEGTSNDYAPAEVPALPSFKLHKFVSEKIVEAGYEYRTGVIYTTNRRVWEHDEDFQKKLRDYHVIAIDMETATIFVTGLVNKIPRGALLLVSDLPTTPQGVKTEDSDKSITAKYVDLHLEIGVSSLTEIATLGEQMKHFTY